MGELWQQAESSARASCEQVLLPHPAVLPQGGQSTAPQHKVSCPQLVRPGAAAAAIAAAGNHLGVVQDWHLRSRNFLFSKKEETSY